MDYRRQGYRDVLDYEFGVRIVVTFTTLGREVVDYAVILTIEHDAAAATVRLHDGSHAVNDMHRYSRAGGKAPAEVFHAGTLGDGMRSAILAIRANHQEMIEAWRAAQT
jgi:hypothetical protein